MLKINNKECKILLSEIRFVSATYNKQKGYSILVKIDIELNDVKGYINFYVDFFNDNDFKNIENKEYNELPTELDSKITMIEIFDTKNFVDLIDSNVIVKFGKILDNKIEINVKIDDELIKLDYQGILDIN